MNKKIKLNLQRIRINDTYIIGRLFINDVYFCDTLENKKLAIPFGTYGLEVSISPRFKRDLPRLQNVQGRAGILIHRGNTAKDSTGCILVGENKEVGKVLNSTPYEEVLTTILKYHQKEGFEMEIEVS